MTDREKLVKLLRTAKHLGVVFPYDYEDIADHLLANGVTVQRLGCKDESKISRTGLMCTACYSDIDQDAVFCKYCGAKMQPEPKEDRP